MTKLSRALALSFACTAIPFSSSVAGGLERLQIQTSSEFHMERNDAAEIGEALILKPLEQHELRQLFENANRDAASAEVYEDHPSNSEDPGNSDDSRSSSEVSEENSGC